MTGMREVKIEKVVVNIGIGEPGDMLKKAHGLLEELTGKKAVLTKTKSRSTFGTPKGREIGTKVTLRGPPALDFLQRALAGKENIVSVRSVNGGNFSFGIKEHIDLPGTRYDPKVGIFGMDVCVTLTRPGFRVARRKISKRIGKTHLISKDETVSFVREKLGAVVE